MVDVTETITDVIGSSSCFYSAAVEETADLDLEIHAVTTDAALSSGSYLSCAAAAAEDPAASFNRSFRI